MSPTLVSQSPWENLLWSQGQGKNTAVTLRTSVKVYVLGLVNTGRKQKNNFKSYRKSKKDLNALIKQKFQKYVPYKKRRKMEI